MKKQEFQPVCEKFDIDITDIKNGIGIEIETGKSDIKKNLRKLNDSPLQSCFMLSTTRPIEFKIKEISDEISKEFSSDNRKIKVMFISDFLKLQKNQIVSTASK